MKIITGILIAFIIAPVAGCASTPTTAYPPEAVSAESPSYEVVNTYTIEVVGDSARFSVPALTLIKYPEACVEIKNTGNTGGLFSVYFFFSEEYFGRDLIYLKPGETGVATYSPVMKVAHFPTDKHKEYKGQTAEWEYEVTPVVLNPSPKK
ncbi:hypothetical protein ES708_08538 [subsurface metagenome]